MCTVLAVQGRAGRTGKAILFIAPREQRMLASIERATKQTITPMELPTVKDINEGRVARFKNKLVAAASDEDLSLFTQIIAEMQHEQEIRCRSNLPPPRCLWRRAIRR